MDNLNDIVQFKRALRENLAKLVEFDLGGQSCYVIYSENYNMIVICPITPNQGKFITQLINDGKINDKLNEIRECNVAEFQGEHVQLMDYDIKNLIGILNRPLTELEMRRLGQWMPDNGLFGTYQSYFKLIGDYL